MCASVQQPRSNNASIQAGRNRLFPSAQALVNGCQSDDVSVLDRRQYPVGTDVTVPAGQTSESRLYRRQCPGCTDVSVPIEQTSDISIPAGQTTVSQLDRHQCPGLNRRRWSSIRVVCHGDTAPIGRHVPGRYRGTTAADQTRPDGAATRHKGQTTVIFDICN